MSRAAKLFILIHLFILYIVLDLQFGCRFVNISHLAYNILPAAFYCYCFYIWLTTSNIKLSRYEKCNIKMLMWFTVVINLYSGICILAGERAFYTTNWIKCHNGYLILFFIFIAINNFIRETI
jgi:hypothetical protein